MGNEPTQVAGGTQLSQPIPGLTIPHGTRLNGIFEIERQIGAGGMGMVYRAHNVTTQEPVAIKIVRAELADNAQVIALFRREAAVLHKLLHDAIVRYYLFTKDDTIGRPYLATEFVDGTPLADILSAGPLPLDDVLRLAERLADGLKAAHALSVFHRDIKPDNIILPGREVERAKIIDFGIAKAATLGEGTIIGDSIAGTFDYMSPEQLGLYGANVDARADIYSLGIVLAEASLGRSLDMGGTQLEVVEKRRKVPDLSQVDARLRPLLTAMLQPRPEDRTQSMAEVVAETQKLRGAPGGNTSPSQSLVKMVATLAGLAMIGGGVWFFLNQDAGPPDDPTPPDQTALQRTDDTDATQIAVRETPPEPRPDGRTQAPPITVPQEAEGLISGLTNFALGGDRTAPTADQPVTDDTGLPPLREPDRAPPVETPQPPLTQDRSTPDPSTGAPTPNDPTVADPTDNPPTTGEPNTAERPSDDGTTTPLLGNNLTDETPAPDEPGVQTAVLDQTPDDTAAPPAAPTVGRRITFPESVDPGESPMQAVRSFVRRTDLGPCTYIRQRATTTGDPVVQGFGVAIAPFQRLNEELQAKIGSPVRINLQQIIANQCAAVELTNGLSPDGDAGLAVDIATDIIQANGTLRGTITGIGGRDLRVFLIASNGRAYEVSAWVSGGPQSRTLQTVMSGTSGASDSHLILAIAGPALPPIPAGVPLDSTAEFNRLAALLRGRPQTEAALGFFKYSGQ
ncbi:MAG: protein kinase [Pseudomonadota bacterium]